MIEIDGDADCEQRCLRLLEAMNSGVGDEIFPLRRSVELIVASGSWGEYGAILVLRLDDDNERVLQHDSYVVERGVGGDWQCPQVGSGSALPTSLWGRASPGRPDWQGAEMAFIGSEFRVIDGVLVASLSLLFSRAVASARIRHGEDALTLTVPGSGYVTVPVRALSDDDLFWVETAGPNGDPIEKMSYRFVPDGLTP
jgi:hypothetical protein